MSNKMKEQLHLDLETLDTKNTAQILSIGAVFNEQEFYAEIDTSYYKHTPAFTLSEDTVEWWAKRGGFQITLPEIVTPQEAIGEFVRWVHRMTKDSEGWEVWANSPSFDCAILRYHMQFFNLPCPWMFWQERDVRTMKAIADALKLQYRKLENPHNALQDAINQQVMVVDIYHKLLKG